jgi:protein TonB
VATEKFVSDRFLIALLIASLLHAVVILGLSFEPPKPETVRKSLSITLVRNASPTAPKTPDFLANEHQSGSGIPKKTIASSPFQALPAENTGKRVEKSPAPPPVPVSESKRKAVLIQEKSAKKILAKAVAEASSKPATPRLSAAALSEQIAEVSMALNQGPETDARQLKTMYINSVNAHKYKAAAYEQAWQQKIERIGNLNYPDEARRQKLSGSLVLAVGIRHDGSVYNIKVRQSSGQPVLDEAAERIVRLAAPFAPFPDELKREADVLYIIRTWRFYSDYRLETH